MVKEKKVEETEGERERETYREKDNNVLLFYVYEFIILRCFYFLALIRYI